MAIAGTKLRDRVDPSDGVETQLQYIINVSDVMYYIHTYYRNRSSKEPHNPRTLRDINPRQSFALFHRYTANRNTHDHAVIVTIFSPI